MAPAAYDTLCAHFQDTGRGPDFYDCIVTGDLGELGGELLCELFRQDGVDLSPSYTDCGRLIFDSRRQDVHCGGSGCGCSAAVFTGYLLRELRAGRLLISASCADAIREFGEYRWAQGKDRDQPVKEQDHAMDDLRYFAMDLAAEEQNGFAATWVERRA